MASQASLATLQDKIWKARLPLEIRLSPSECRTYDQCDPYLISVSRLSYLPPLLPRLLDFFYPLLIVTPSTPYDGYFTFSKVPLKWHLPIGLLYDIYSPTAAPHSTTLGPSSSTHFSLTLHFTPTATSTAHLSPLTPYPGTFHDSFINAAKEADFLRSGTAKPIMSLSEASSRSLFNSVGSSATTLDFLAWKKVMAELVPRDASAFRALPLRVYLPTSSAPPVPSAGDQSSSPRLLPAALTPNTTVASADDADAAFAVTSHLAPGQIKTLQLHARPVAQTLGQALNTLLPSLFPSRRNPVHARPVLHGAAVPMAAPLEELVRWAGYADGWLGVVVVLL